MIFLIDIVDSEHQVIVYESIPDLIQRVEWQDIFEGKSIIIDENGTEYEWDSTKRDEIELCTITLLFLLQGFRN